MRTRWNKAALVIGMAGVLGLLGPAVWASTSTETTGAWVITLTPQAVSFADGNTFIGFTLAETITGTVAGTRVGAGRLVIHPDGTLNAHDAGTFTGTAGGAVGTGTMLVEASGTFTALTGQVFLSDGTGGLAGVHGNFRIVGAAIGPTTFAGTYTGQVH